MSKYGLRLFPQHQKLLERSGIDPKVSDKRGYVSVDQKTRLAPLGFAENQRIVPGLLVPIWGPEGDHPATYQYRPDNPRTDDDGRVVKYENPTKGKTSLDIPLRHRPFLSDASTDLLITEGARKVDAAADLGFACVGLLGVDMWARRDVDGGPRHPLPGWKSIALKGRRVFIAYDSDLLEKVEVRRALRGLVRFLCEQGATVLVVEIPPGPNGEKVGLDDYLGAGGHIGELLVSPGWDYVVPATPTSRGRQSAPFPLDTYPKALDEFIDQAARDTSAPRNYLAAGILPVAGAALGSESRIHIGGPWFEFPAIWLACVGPSGVAKSPGMRALMGPLRGIDKELQIGNRAAMEAWEESDPKTRGPKPIPRQVIVGDSTIEALGVALAVNRKMLLYADELRSLVTGFDQYRAGHGKDRQTWLSLWASELVKVGRIGRDPLHVDEPFLGVLGGIQPSLLSAFAGDDGLFPRILFVLESEQAETQGLPSGRCAPSYAAWDDVVRRLHRSPGGTVGLSDAAWKLGDVWYRRRTEMARSNVDGLGEVHSKMRGYVFRFALILHRLDGLLEGTTGPVTEGQMERAIAVAEWFTDNARLAMQADDRSNHRDVEWAAKLAKLRTWISERPGCTKRQILRGGPAWARRSKALEEALVDLGIELTGHGPHDG